MDNKGRASRLFRLQIIASPKCTVKLSDSSRHMVSTEFLYLPASSLIINYRAFTHDPRRPLPSHQKGRHIRIKSRIYYLVRYYSTDFLLLPFISLILICRTCTHNSRRPLPSHQKASRLCASTLKSTAKTRASVPWSGVL